MAEAAVIMPQQHHTPAVEHPMPADRSVNVGDLERWLSLLGGGMLALYSLRRSLGHFVLLSGAGALLYRGLTGHCALYKTMGVNTVHQNTGPDGTHSTISSNEEPLIEIVRS
jgi:uncharacterized membrane protein